MNGDVSVVTPLAAVEARALVERIRVSVTAVIDDIVEALNRRAWIALGYTSWEDLCEHEFTGIRLPERQAIVLQLRAGGMSLRAISAVTGTPKTTVGDLVDVDTGVQIRTPETVTGIDGKSYKPKLDGDDDDERLTQIRKLAADGLSGGAIADLVGLTDRQIRRIARKNEIAVGKRSRGAVAERIERTRRLAAEGMTSHQIAAELGVGFQVVRRYVKDHQIEVVADTVSRVHRMDSVRIVSATIDALDGIDVMFDHIDYDELPLSEIAGWITILETSLKSLTTLRRHLKEAIR